MLRIKLVRSPIGNTKRNRSIVAALGLRKMHHTVDHRDTPQIRGMVHKVKHLLDVSEISESEAKPRTTGTPQRARTVPPGSAPKKIRHKRVRPKPMAKTPKPKAPWVRPEPKAKPEKVEAKPKAAAKPKAEPKAAKAKAEAKPKSEAKPKAAKPKAKKEDK
jgi:large subunit ribosomal protein L30